MGYENLSPEQRERAKACKSPEELAALVEEEGLELSDEMLDGIAGGGFDPSNCKGYLNICVRYRPERPTDEERLDCHGFYLN